MGMGFRTRRLDRSHDRGDKPSPRYGHAMAYRPRPRRDRAGGGWDIDTGSGLADVGNGIRAPGAWTQRLDGSEPNLPTGRMYARSSPTQRKTFSIW